MYTQGWRPIFGQDGETNMTIAIDMRVDWYVGSNESDFW